MKHSLHLLLAVLLIATNACSKPTKVGSSGNNSGGTSKSKGGTIVSESAPAPAATITGKLAVGEPVPEIAGWDTDGEAFKLSDYKGKVLMIDFWGDW